MSQGTDAPSSLWVEGLWKGSILAVTSPQSFCCLVGCSQGYSLLEEAASTLWSLWSVCSAHYSIWLIMNGQLHPSDTLPTPWHSHTRGLSLLSSGIQNSVFNPPPHGPCLLWGNLNPSPPLPAIIVHICSQSIDAPAAHFSPFQSLSASHTTVGFRRQW